jgi:hypothetical protein
MKKKYIIQVDEDFLWDYVEELDDPLHENVSSGNQDPLDAVHSICMECGGINGKHYSHCFLL